MVRGDSGLCQADKANSQSNLRKSLFGLSSCRDSPLWQGGYDNERRPNCGSGNRRHLLTLYSVRKQREVNVGTQLALSFFPSPGVVLPLPEVGLPPSVKHLRNLPHRLKCVSEVAPNPAAVKVNHHCLHSGVLPPGHIQQEPPSFFISWNLHTATLSAVGAGVQGVQCKE